MFEKTLFYVGRRSSRGSGNHRHQRSPNGISDVRTKKQTEHGDKHHSTAQPSQRAQETGNEGTGPNKQAKLQDSHELSVALRQNLKDT